jgi:hypothetical protein
VPPCGTTSSARRSAAAAAPERTLAQANPSDSSANMCSLHPQSVRDEALALLAEGLNVARSPVAQACPGRRCVTGVLPATFAVRPERYARAAGNRRGRLGSATPTMRSCSGSTSVTVTSSVWAARTDCGCSSTPPTPGSSKRHARCWVVASPITRWASHARARAPRRSSASDGCFFIKPHRAHRYPSHDFTNYSSDIAKLFAEACDLAGVRYRRNIGKDASTRVRIYRRESVAILLRTVGLKD